MFDQYEMMYFAIMMYCEINNTLNDPMGILEYLSLLPPMDTMNQETIIEYVMFFDEFKLLPTSSLSYSEKCVLLNETFQKMKSNSYDTDDETSYETLSTQDVSDDETRYDTLSTQDVSDDETLSTQSLSDDDYKTLSL
jgi:hypothetical protein